jgi:hypothetical protein
LARYLGVEEFGRFTLVWMSVLFVNSIQHSAINSPMMAVGAAFDFFRVIWSAGATVDAKSGLGVAVPFAAGAPAIVLAISSDK